MNNKIIVIVPVFNGEKYIKKCINSIIEQYYDNWELYVIDDGSSDGTFEIIKEFEKDKRIHAFKKNNEGAGKARNFGLSLIKELNGYIVFIDSDDYVDPAYFQLLSSHNEDVVFVDVEQRDMNDKRIKREIISRYRSHNKNDVLRKQMTGYIPWGGVRKAAKASLVREHNICFSDNRVGEEALYSFDVLLYAKTIGFIDSCVYFYIQRGDSLSSSFNENPWLPVADNLKAHLKKNELYGIYANTINAFYVTACTIAVKRVSRFNYKVFKEKVFCLKNNLNEKIDKEYTIDKASLNWKSKIVYSLVKHNFFRIAFLLAKLSG